MLLDSEKANEMQSAVDRVFAGLPDALKTIEVRTEIAKVVVQSTGDYELAAFKALMDDQLLRRLVLNPETVAVFVNELLATRGGRRCDRKLITL
jgi:hypothetical protein